MFLTPQRFYTHKLEEQLDLIDRDYGDEEAKKLWKKLKRKIPGKYWFEIFFLLFWSQCHMADSI